MYLLQKYFFTAFTLSCPLPGGIFTPTFTMGAVIGQIYCGLLLRILGFFGKTGLVEYRGIYSIIGAAAMTCSVTRTVSVGVIVLELNGHMSHLVPVMVTTVTSYFVSEWLRPLSFFEQLAILRGLYDKKVDKQKILMKDILAKRPEYTEFEYITLNDTTPY